MTQYDPQYLDALATVHRLDQEHLNRKDREYEGSWKARGGAGAFFMLARKWDRLEPMCRRHGYDIFAAVAANPGDEDGTPLAEVRDMRRYLALVEAHLMHEGVVAVPAPEEASLGSTSDAAIAASQKTALQAIPDDLYMDFALHWGTTREEAKRRALRIVWGSDSIECTPDQLLRQACAKWGFSFHARAYAHILRCTRQGTVGLAKAIPPEDSNRHAQQNYLMDGMPLEDYAVTPSLVVPGVSPEIGIVHRSAAPAGTWEHLPRVALELNHQEWKETPLEYQWMYNWDEGASKYVLASSFREHWGKV